MREARCTAYLEDSPRVIFVVCDATVTHPPLSHNSWVEASVGERRIATAVRFTASNELVDGCVSPVFLLDLAVPAASHVQETTPSSSSESDKANHDARGNGSLVG
jgi:hypothetical protein